MTLNQETRELIEAAALCVCWRKPRIAEGWWNGGRWRLWCPEFSDSCGFSGPCAYTPSEAVEKWNEMRAVKP